MRPSKPRAVRVAALFALLLLATIGLTGCADREPTNSRMALAKDGDRLILLSVACAGEVHGQVSITDLAAQDASRREAWTIAKTAPTDRAATGEIRRFTAFELPPGFKQVESGLTGLTEGAAYYARADTTAEFEEAGVSFTLADVPSIADGVLANVAMGSDATAVIPESQLITRYCG